MFVALAVSIAGLIAVLVIASQVLRLRDVRFEAEASRSLVESGAREAETFDPQTVASLPDPARRFFLYSISPGARLHKAAEIEMTGELSLGTKEKPDYMPMRASQVIAGKNGFVWRLQTGSGLMRISGSDGYFRGNGWTRFWLFGLIPVVRAGGDADFARSAAGRAIAESAFWLPATLLPEAGVTWEPVDDDTARARVTHDGVVHLVDITVAADGRPRSVSIDRWSRENPERQWRSQPFGGTIEEVRVVDGYKIAWRVDGGNWFGTDRYFPFYRAQVQSFRFR